MDTQPRFPLARNNARLTQASNSDHIYLSFPFPLHPQDVRAAPDVHQLPILTNYLYQLMAFTALRFNLTCSCPKQRYTFIFQTQRSKHMFVYQMGNMHRDCVLNRPCSLEL